MMDETGIEDSFRPLVKVDIRNQPRKNYEKIVRMVVEEESTLTGCKVELLKLQTIC